MLFTRTQFRHPWRSYQTRVLAMLDEHLGDDHLHLVAPPGSGKTVLGLEVIRRLGHPALVLVPSIAIREQWLRRLEHDFLPGGYRAGDISTDPMSPATLTVSTYQALYSLFHAGRNEELISVLQNNRVTTLAVDEAHHLRAQWWRCLQEVKENLHRVTTVALTGTPPYDAPQAEWNRYAGFCGEVDEEIGIPELVQDGNLCPHQDFIYLCQPATGELQQLQQFEALIAGFLRDLAIDMDLARILAKDSRLQAPQEHLDDILKASEFWLSVAVFMNDLRWESVRKLVTAIGLRQVGLPLFDLEWAELLLNGLLFDNRCQVPGMEEKLHHLHQRLHNIGAVERRRVRLRGQKRNLRLLQSGQGMLRAISDIVELEGRMQQQRMRLVILTDHIRESALPSPQDTDRPFEKLGVVPIFETLRRLQLPNLRLCILTGSIVVIPRDCESFLREDAASHHIPFERFRLEELWHAPEFLRVKFTGSEGSKSVELITAIFARGLLNTIVGTASLLGEGWDAPSVNTLIMASAVAAHVSSNQMRGRAIRSLKSNPFKVANIWHLACVAPHADEQDRRDWFISANCGEESMASTRIRFRAFVGLSLEQPLIESGIERLGEQQCPPSSAGIDAWNARMVHHASRRDELAGRWKEALGPPSPGRSRLVRELRLDTGYLHSIFRINPREHGSGGIWQSLFYRWFIWRSRRRLVKIALATAEALATLKIITPGSIPVVESSEGRLFQVTLPAANHLDQTRFVEALAELFTPLNSPRYLLLRHHRYYAVPTNCGEKKPRALLYAAAWLRRVGKAKLIFTQNRAGRLHLLKAKEQALATYFNYSLDTRMRWLNTPNQ